MKCNEEVGHVLRYLGVLGDECTDFPKWLLFGIFIPLLFQCIITNGILDKINKGKYDLPMQIKSLYLALFANFGHQSMHQVLQGILN